MELWLYEIEGKIMSEDYGKDLNSVKNIKKKNEMIEDDVGYKKERIEGIRVEDRKFVERGKLDDEKIKDKEVELNER